MKKIWVVIPAYNEAATIGRVVKEVKPYADQIIVINDASTDETAAQVKNLGVKLISHKQRLGYAKALELGLRKAFENKADYCICWDADGQHLVKNLPKMLAIIKSGRFDIVVGKRQRRNRLMELVWGMYSKLNFGLADPLCGLKAYSKDVFERYGFLEKRYTIGTELLFRAARDGVNIKEIDVVVKKRAGQSRFGDAVKGNWLEAIAFYNTWRIFG